MKKLFCLLLAACSVCLVGCGTNTNDDKCDECGIKSNWNVKGGVVAHFDEEGKMGAEDCKYELCLNCANEKFHFTDN